jgi:hypothetical protein
MSCITPTVQWVALCRFWLGLNGAFIPYISGIFPNGGDVRSVVTYPPPQGMGETFSQKNFLKKFLHGKRPLEISLKFVFRNHKFHSENEQKSW